VLSYLVPATGRFGENYDDLSEMYIPCSSSARWSWALSSRSWRRRPDQQQLRARPGHLHAGAAGPAARGGPVPGRQRPADAQELIDPNILSRIEPSGAADRILQSQASIVNGLLSETRVKRMVDQEAMARPGMRPYTVAEMMEDLRKGVWGDLAAPAVTIDPYRRNLQRAYLAALAARIAPVAGAPPGIPAGSQSDVRPLARLALVTTKASIQNAMKRTTDPVTKAHLMDSLATIDRALNPRV
jgi:hypothetical protein